MQRVIGPLVPGRAYIIGARPSNGKTSFIQNWLDRHVERVTTGKWGKEYPRRVALFMTERSPEVSRVCWACLKLGYDADAALSENWEELPVGAQEKIDAAVRVIQNIERNGWVTFVPGGRLTVGEIGDAVADIEPHIVIFDYVQRVKPLPKQTRWDAVAEAAALFQQMAVELGRIVIVASQLKRRGDGVFDKYRPPHLEDFKLASDIEEMADVAIGLYRPLKKITAKEERAIRGGQDDLENFKIEDTMAIKVLKHRYRGPAADRILFVTCKDSRITDKERPNLPPVDAGDAWEEDAGVPF
jgi:hypothetical protein